MISYDTFCQEAEYLETLSHSKSHNEEASTCDHWKIRSGKRQHLPGNKYLVCTVVRKRRQVGNSHDNRTDLFEKTYEDQEIQLDECTLSPCHRKQQQLQQQVNKEEEEMRMVVYEFHIVYHIIYQTPVLYFQVTNLDGFPLSCSQENDGLLLPGGTQKGTFISMEMHPVLGLPFYFLHPCETSSAMDLLVSASSSSSLDPTRTATPVATVTRTRTTKDNTNNNDKSPSYLLSWLSLVAPLTGILPMDYLIDLKKKKKL